MVARLRDFSEQSLANSVPQWQREAYRSTNVIIDTDFTDICNIKIP